MHHSLLFLIATATALGSYESQDSLAVQTTQAISLEDAEGYCLSNSFDLKASKLMEEAVRSAYLQSSGALLPRVSYSGNCTAHRAVNRVPAGGISLTQPLFAPSLWVQKSLGQVGWLNASLERIALENHQLYLVRTAYFGCVLAQVQQRVQKDRVEVLQQALMREQQQVEVGHATAFDVDQARVAVANALTQYFDSRQGVRVARDQLSSLLGIDAREAKELRVCDDEIGIDRIDGLRDAYARLAALCPDALDASGLLYSRVERHAPGKRWGFSDRLVAKSSERAMKYNPELRIERLKVATALVRIKQTMASYAPEVSVSFARNQIDPNYTPWRGRQQNIGSINLSWTLFDGGAREQNARGSRLKWRAQRLQWDKKRNDLYRQMHQQFRSIEERLLALFAARAGEAMAARALQQAQVRQEAGRIAPLDFRIAANELVRAQSTQTRAAYDAIIAHFKLVEMCADDYRIALDALGDAQWRHE